MIVARWQIRELVLKALATSIVLAGVYFSIALGLFIIFGLWVDLFLPLLIIVVTYVGTTLYEFLLEIKKRQLLEKELDIARMIQKKFLHYHV